MRKNKKNIETSSREKSNRKSGFSLDFYIPSSSYRKGSVFVFVWEDTMRAGDNGKTVADLSEGLQPGKAEDTAPRNNM
jgi:hypothetical protein